VNFAQLITLIPYRDKAFHVSDHDHEFEESFNKSGSSTNFWICRVCGLVKQTGPANFEEAHVVEHSKPSILLEHWIQDPVISRNILRSIAGASEGLSENAVFGAVKREVATLYTLRDYMSYLIELGYVSDEPTSHTGAAQERHVYRVTEKGRRALEDVSASADRVTDIFPRDPKHDRRTK